MDRKKLDELKYDREADPQNIITKDEEDGEVYLVMEAGRCIHCGRIFLNPKYGIAFCRECDEAMSTSRRGPEFDFQFMIHPPQTDPKTGVTKTPPNPLHERSLREPIPFDMEEGFKRAEKDNFKLASGKPLPVEEEEDEKIRRLYDLR